jgi:penicillin-binding protein 1A
MNYGKKQIKKKKEDLSSPDRSLNNRISIWVVRIIILAIAFAAALMIARGIIYAKAVVADAPSISAVENPVSRTTKVLDTDGKVIARFSMKDLSVRRISSSRMPKQLKDAFVSYVDPEFYEHDGILMQNMISYVVRGELYNDYDDTDATISEHLINNTIYFGVTSDSSTKAVKQRLQRQYLASRLEQEHSKQWILENYLNTVMLGNDTVGIEAASERYFGKEAKDLNLTEISALAACSGEPEARNPLDHPEVNQEYRKKVLLAMYKGGCITKSQYLQSREEDIADYVTRADKNGQDTGAEEEAFALALKDQVIADLETQLKCSQEQAEHYLYLGGMTIYSTLDSGIQNICRKAVNRAGNYSGSSVSVHYTLSIRQKDGKVRNYTEVNMRSWYRSKGRENYTLSYPDHASARAAVLSFRQAMLTKGDTFIGENLILTPEPQASLVMTSQSTGEVKAMIGGRNISEDIPGYINRATDTYYSPGNISDIFSIYAPALDSGKYTLSSIPTATGETAASGDVDNIDNLMSSDGTSLTVRSGIRQESQAAAAYVLKGVTQEISLESLEKYAFARREDSASFRASGEILEKASLMEINAAYGAIAARGIYTKNAFYSKVFDREGRPVLDVSADSKRSTTVMKDTTAFLLTKAMQETITSGIAKRSEIKGMTSAAQQGVSTDESAWWFAGFTPYYTCTVWSGNDDGQPIHENTAAARIWKQVMQQVSKGQKDMDFTRPDGIVSEEICRDSGLLAIEGVCQNTYSEYYAAGTEPSEKCNLHETAIICKDSGLLAGPYCPEESKVKEVFVRDSSKKGKKMPTKVCTLHTAKSTAKKKK